MSLRETVFESHTRSLRMDGASWFSGSWTYFSSNPRPVKFGDDPGGLKIRRTNCFNWNRGNSVVLIVRVSVSRLYVGNDFRRRFRVRKVNLISKIRSTLYNFLYRKIYWRRGSIRDTHPIFDKDESGGSLT
jgi:hypothetical protein